MPIAEAVLNTRERRQLRLFVRRDAYGRFLSCLVYLPRDRYTRAVRERIAAHPQASGSAATRSSTPPGSASRCSPGCTSSSAAEPGRD